MSSEANELGKYGLPLEVRFCKKCTMSNQRPSSSVEFKNIKGEKKRPLTLDDHGICDACNFSEKKKLIDWAGRDDMLRDLCDRFRRIIRIGESIGFLLSRPISISVIRFSHLFSGKRI